MDNSSKFLVLVYLLPWLPLGQSSVFVLGVNSFLGWRVSKRRSTLARESRDPVVPPAPGSGTNIWKY